jgi:DNA repair exonuclease SbcCD ATPase subunit
MDMPRCSVHIESVHLHGFGRLAGREFRFGPGLTVVHGPNEAGKSTLHAALSAALFGLVGSGRRKRDDTARIERFRPWDGARYAATAEVVATGGRRLRLEWDFDRARVAVVDAAAGTDVTREYGGGDPDELVRALWGVERGVYLHLGHVAQAELARISDPAGVRHAIEAVVGQGAADSPAQAAVAALKEQRARLVGLNSAATKPLARARAERDRLAGAVADAAAERGAVDELASERDTARAAAEAADRRVGALEHAAAHVRARELRRRIEWADEAERAALAATAVVEREAEHADFVPSSEVGALRHRLRDLEAERDRRSGERVLDTQRLTEVEREQAALAARADALAPHRGASARAAEIDALALAAERGGDGRRRLLGLIALGGAVAVAAVAVGQPALAAVAVIAGIASLALALRRTSPRASELDRALPGTGPVEERLAAHRAACAADRELDRIERELGRVQVSYAGLRADLAALDQIERERAQVSDRVRSELMRAGFDDSDLEDGLRRYDAAASGHAQLVEAAATQRQKRAELERLLGDESLAEARRRLGEIESGLNGHAALADGRDLADVETERAAAEAERDRAALSATALDTRLSERQRSAPRVAELREQLDEAIELVGRLEHTDAVLRLAEAELAAAADETYRDVAPLLGAALAEPISRLTAGRYATAFVEDDLGVRLETPERGEVVDLAALSHGTQRQVYLVQRLELVRLLCPAGATPPVLLDDPFAHVDAERVERTLAYLSDLAADRQLILFSTDRAAVDLAPSSAAVIRLALEGGAAAAA